VAKRSAEPLAVKQIRMRVEKGASLAKAVQAVEANAAKNGRSRDVVHAALHAAAQTVAAELARGSTVQGSRREQRVRSKPPKRKGTAGRGDYPFTTQDGLGREVITSGFESNRRKH
jgi:hypothetical protein